MADWLTPGNVMFVVGLIGILFTVYNSFRNPQIDSDKKDALLAQQLQFMNESTERRFTEMAERLTQAMGLAQNHIHTVDTKVETLNTTVGAMGIQIATLGTIIEERIPKK